MAREGMRAGACGLQALGVLLQCVTQALRRADASDKIGTSSDYAS